MSAAGRGLCSRLEHCFAVLGLRRCREDRRSGQQFHIEDEYASCWTNPLHDAMMTSTEDETTSMRFLRTAQLLHPILLPFLDVNSMLMLRAICRDSVSEQAFLGHCVEISMEISSFNNLAASLSDLRRPATWKAWRCLMCVAAQPKWFGQNSSRVLDLAEDALEACSTRSLQSASSWIVSQLACLGCAGLKAVLLQKLCTRDWTLRHNGSFVRQMVEFSRMVDKPWVMLLKRLMPGPGTPLTWQTLSEVESLFRASQNPAREYALFVPVIAWRVTSLRNPAGKARLQELGALLCD